MVSQWVADTKQAKQPPHAAQRTHVFSLFPVANGSKYLRRRTWTGYFIQAVNSPDCWSRQQPHGGLSDNAVNTRPEWFTRTCNGLCHTEMAANSGLFRPNCYRLLDLPPSLLISPSATKNDMFTTDIPTLWLHEISPEWHHLQLVQNCIMSHILREMEASQLHKRDYMNCDY